MPVKNQYVFASFISGLNEKSDELQLNNMSKDDTGEASSLNLELRSVENFRFDSVGKISNKKFDRLLHKDSEPVISLKSTSDTLFNLNIDNVREYSEVSNRFRNVGTLPFASTDKHFVSARATSIAYDSGNLRDLGQIEEQDPVSGLFSVREGLVDRGIRYIMVVADDFRNGKVFRFDSDFKILQTRNLDAGIRSEFLGERNFYITINAQIPYILIDNRGTIIDGQRENDSIMVLDSFGRFSKNIWMTFIEGRINIEPRTVQIKVKKNLLFILYRTNRSPLKRLVFTDYLAQNETYFLAPENTTEIATGISGDEFDVYFDDELDNYYIYVLENNNRIMRSYTLHSSDNSVVETTNSVLAGISSNIQVSSENKNLMACGRSNFMMSTAGGTVIKDARNKYSKIFGFKPYYILKQGDGVFRYVIYANNGFYIVDFNKKIQAKYSSTTVPQDADIFQSGNAFVDDPLHRVIPSLEAFRVLQPGANNVFVTTSNDSAHLVVFEPEYPASKSVLKVNNNVYFSGSLISTYDGKQVTPIGFNQIPILKLSSAHHANDGTQLVGVEGDPVFRFQAIYRWTDGQGNIYRSHASNLLTFNMKSTYLSGSENIVPEYTFQVSNLNLTDKQDVFIELYRSGANLPQLRKADDIPNDTQNENSYLTITLDKDLVSSGAEIFYVTSGRSNNTQPEGCRFLQLYNSRVYLMRTNNDRTKVVQSQPVSNVSSEGLDFSNTGRSYYLPDDITATEVMDDKLLIFTNNQVFQFRENFPEPEPVVGDLNVGCSDLGATVLDKDGVYFKSQKGVYLLDRGLSLSYVGYHADVSLKKRIVECTNDPNENEIYFLNEDGDIVVYNTFFKNFYIRNSKRVRSITSTSDKTYVSTDTNEIYLQDASESLNLENFRLETGWIQLSHSLNRQRIREMYLLGDIDGIEGLRLILNYDFSPSDFFIQDLTKEDIRRSKVFGSGDIFRGPEIFGLTEGRHMYRFFPNRQECVSIKLKVSVQSQKEFSLSGIGFKYGIKSMATKFKSIRGS